MFDIHQLIHKKILCIYTCNMLLDYLVKVENAKMLPNFHVERNK